MLPSLWYAVYKHFIHVIAREEYIWYSMLVACVFALWTKWAVFLYTKPCTLIIAVFILYCPETRHLSLPAVNPKNYATFYVLFCLMMVYMFYAIYYRSFSRIWSFWCWTRNVSDKLHVHQYDSYSCHLHSISRHDIGCVLSSKYANSVMRNDRKCDYGFVFLFQKHIHHSNDNFCVWCSIVSLILQVRFSIHYQTWR